MGLKEIATLVTITLMLLTIFYNFVYTRAQDKTTAENTAKSIQDVKFEINTKLDQSKIELNTKIDRHISDNEKLYSTVLAQLNRLWEYKDSHGKDAADMRLELQKQIGKVEAGLLIQDGQYAEILRLIESMSKSVGEKIDKLETKFEKFVKN